VAKMRMRIAAGATVLGLGGLAGLALASNDGSPASAASQATAEQSKPTVHTQVIHRTIHVRPQGDSGSSAPAVPASGSVPAVAPSSAGSYDDDSDYSDDSGSYDDDSGSLDDDADNDDSDHESGEIGGDDD